MHTNYLASFADSTTWLFERGINTLKQLEKWIQDLRYLEGRQPSTLTTYRRFVGKFLRSVQNDTIIQADVDDFVRSLLEAGVNPGYVNSLSGAINSFLSW
jgi:hypothetical protein